MRKRSGPRTEPWGTPCADLAYGVPQAATFAGRLTQIARKPAEDWSRHADPDLQPVELCSLDLYSVAPTRSLSKRLTNSGQCVEVKHDRIFYRCG